MAAAISPLVDFDVPPSAFPHQHHPSTEHFSPHHRPDTPQLTLHDFHKLQHSPHLSASPDSDTHRRVRRKPSVANLWTSASASPHLIHSFAHPSLLLSSLPPPPATPRPRPNTASPSLSSTVTTLQSTPTHTPVLRGGSHVEQRRVNERIELAEPIRTKRKFDSLKQAKRLPRRAGGDRESIERDGEIWEVYAAVYEPAGDFNDPDEQAAYVSDESEVRDDQSWLQPAPLSAQQIAPDRQQVRAVHFQEADSRPATQDVGDLAYRSTASGVKRQEKDSTATSSYSLSKFQFPVPPGHDNWTGTFGHLTEPNSPSTPATLHYHGASFDVVNPHASLLLEGHQFETPAEIDGLLDDYFDTKTEGDDMPYDGLTGESSQSSLRTGSDSSRHARVLYEDPDSARRHILRVQEELPSPPPALLNNSPLTNKNVTMDTNQGGHFSPLPAQETGAKPNNNPFRGLPSIARVFGFGGANEDVHPQGDAGKIEEGRSSVDEAAFGDVKANLSPSASGQLKSHQGSLRRATHCSDPFDLTISESGSNANLLSIEEVLKNEQRAENAPTHAQGADAVDAPSPGAGAVSQATCVDQETDPTIKEIIGSYDYTPVPSSPEKDELADSSPSIEQARSIPGSKAKGKQPVQITRLPMPARSMSVRVHDATIMTPVKEEDEVTTPDSAVALVPQFPTPPTPVYKVWSNCQELPSSDQTYGDTNQLLQITPGANEASYPPYPDGSPETNPFRRNWHGGPSKHYPYPTGARSSSAGTIIRHNRNSDVPDQFRFVDEDEEEDTRPPLPRSSSVYPFDPVYDGSSAGDITVTGDEPARNTAGEDESAWETASRSATRCSSDGSYADTSALGTENRLSAVEMPLPGKAAMPRSRPSQRTKFEAPPDRPADEHDYRRDTQKAISLLSDHIIVEAMRSKLGSVPDMDKEQRKLDFQELERLRRTNPAAVREATEFLANHSLDKVKDLGAKAHERFLKMKAFKPEYKPENIFKKAKSLLPGTSSVRSGSDHRFLLGTPEPEQERQNYGWDDSEGDFITVRSGHAPTPGVWSPFDQNTTEQALARPSPPASVPASVTNCSGPAFENGRPVKRAREKRPRCAAMGGQKELHELKLLQPNRNNVRNNARRGRGLTDAELARREPGWSTKPKRFASSPLVNAVSSAQPAYQQPDIELMSPRLRPGAERGIPTSNAVRYAEIQQGISDNWSLWCRVVPFASLIYALGGFDSVVRKRTNGNCDGMTPHHKRYSLLLWFPLCLCGWALLIVVILVLVSSAKWGNDGGLVTPPPGEHY